MPVTYSNIGLQEPSTITNKVAAVSIDRGSTTEQQEILVLGDPQSSLGLAQVVASDPASTAYGLVVRPVGYSTTVQVSSLAGTVLVSPVSTASVRVAQSTAADLQATVTPASTVWAVQAAQSGSWTVRANVSSTAADNPVTVSGTVSVSPVSTAMTAVRPASTHAYGQVGISTAATLIAAANAGRQRLLVVQHGGVAVYLGASTVTATTGLFLSSVAGNQIVLRHDDAVYGITAASTGTISFVEETL